MRLFGGDEKRLKHGLQHPERHADEDDARVLHAVHVQISLGFQQPCHGGKHRESDQRENNADTKRKLHQKGEIRTRFFVFALAERTRNDGAAARAQHEAHCAHNHQKGHNQIDGGKGRFPREIRNEQPVHNAVNRRKNHHTNAWKHEFQQRGIMKMIG